jgi:S-adenosylmethionine hydrolase
MAACSFKLFDRRQRLGYNGFMAGKVITLTTDFGLADGYVGAMKGVILGIAPDVTIVDLSHEVRPQDVRHAAFLVKTVSRYFPEDAIHVVVVDPGVGTRRRVLVARTASSTFVGPDNGVLSWTLDEQGVERVISATESRYWRPEVSLTFHGRDIFAPLGAHLAKGVPIEALGLPVSDWRRIPFPTPRLNQDESQVDGEILYVDRFGNLVTNLEVKTESGLVQNVIGPPIALGEHVIITVGSRHVSGLRRSYAEAEPGQLLAIIGSAGYLELAVREGNAAALLGVTVGDAVQIQWVRALTGS